MRIEDAFRDHEVEVDGLIKIATKFTGTLKAWKKACQTGHVGARDKAAALATSLAPELAAHVDTATGSWSFDVRQYLEGDHWRTELQDVCATRMGLRVFEEDEKLVSPPVLVRSDPAKTRLIIGKVGWPTLNPSFTAKELKRLNERSATTAALQQFLNSLYEGAKRVNKDKDHLTRLRDIYGIFSLAPGWARENSWASFAQQLYALQMSEVRTTKDGRGYKIDGPTGKYTENDVFSVISESGGLERYHAIWFR